MENSRNLVLDLHGRRLDDAIREVTLFLERIRREHATVRATSGASNAAASASAVGSAVVENPLYATIITGSGSHGSQGPVLRNAIQRLLQKRGMAFMLERGGGAFQIDAMSGWDLYDEGSGTDSKVLLVEQEEFRQLASTRRNSSQCSYGAAIGNSLHPRSASSPGCIVDTSNDPLPSQVAAEDDDLQSALQFSIKDSQQQYNLQDRTEREYDRECRRAVSASQAEHIAYGRKQLAEEIEFRKTLSLICNNEGQLDKDLHQNRIKMQADMEKSANGDSEIEGENAMLEKVSEQSLLDEQQRLQQIQQQYDAELELALKQSAQLEQPNDNDDELLKAILATSLLEEEQMKTPEEELLQKAMEQSLKEAEMMNSSEEEFIQKVLAQSLEEKDDCKKDDLLEKVIQLSLEEKEMEAMDEETALERAIALSMGNGIEENGKTKSK